MKEASFSPKSPESPESSSAGAFPRTLFLLSVIPGGPETVSGGLRRPRHEDAHNAAILTLRQGLGIFASPEFQKNGALTRENLERAMRKPLPDLPEIMTEPLGKPYFRDPCLPCFSFAHSGNLVFLGISDCPLGVDAERVTARRNLDGISKRFYSPEEQNYLKEAETPSVMTERFFELWTLREAAGKLTGAGIQDFEKTRVIPGSGRLSVAGKEMRAFSGKVLLCDDIWYLAAALPAGKHSSICPPPELITASPESFSLVSWKLWTKDS
ncbi:4'-phosphopantetheinyl transferase family protein [Succinimonas sp.]|uniref:4'-phosphopantetheinyl transferase family protein n=1 Tax=Succinimonas sp. TaxID=1936151 RepID=UPI0038693359